MRQRGISGTDRPERLITSTGTLAKTTYIISPQGSLLSKTQQKHTDDIETLQQCSTDTANLCYSVDVVVLTEGLEP